MKIAIAKLAELPAFYEKLKDENIPFRTAYKLLKMSESASTEIRFYYSEMSKLAQKYGEIADGDVKIKPENEEKFNEEAFSLQSMEIDFPDYNFTLEEFSAVQLSVRDIVAIAPFIIED